MASYIPLSQPYDTGADRSAIVAGWKAVQDNQPSAYIEPTERFLKDHYHAEAVLLTASCTAALHISLCLLNLSPGDEVILPSYTFVSAATAVIAQGAIPVMVDIEGDTLNVSAEAIADAITPRTRAILVMHYAGVVADMSAIGQLARDNNLYLIEDIAHCIGARDTEDKPIGTQGHLSTLSFHHTKNIHCGNGGALIINDPQLIHRAYHLRDKGTDRNTFLSGTVALYQWVDHGNSYGIHPMAAALLAEQLHYINEITEARRRIDREYRSALKGFTLMPEPTSYHNGHIFYLLADDADQRQAIAKHLKSDHIESAFHYIPLHKSVAGKKYARWHGRDEYTSERATRLLRLPIWPGLDTHRVIDCLHRFLS